MRPDAASDDSIELLSFEVCRSRFGVPLGAVVQVARAVAITYLPSAPAAINGLIEVRGQLVAVLDTRFRFGLPARLPDWSEHLIIAQAGKRQVALRADRALDIVRVPAGLVRDLDSVVRHADAVAGVARLDDGLLLIHDLDTFLSTAEESAIDAAIEAAGGEPAGSGAGDA